MTVVNNNTVIKVEACGKKRTLYRYYCPKCEKDMGYKRRSYNKKCRKCTHLELADKRLEKYKKKYPNVDFDDYIDKSYKSTRRKETRHKKEYRTTCRYCGSDKGYVRKALFDTRCYKCTMTADRKTEISCKQRGIDVQEFDGFMSPENTRARQSEEGRRWREAVFKKHNYTCDCCGEVGGYLHAHHLYSFSTHVNRRFDVSNGVCLCKDCHVRFHSEYGKGANTEEQYLLFKSAYSNT